MTCIATFVGRLIYWIQTRCSYMIRFMWYMEMSALEELCKRGFITNQYGRNWTAGKYSYNRTSFVQYFKITRQMASQCTSFPLTYNRPPHWPPSAYLRDLILCTCVIELGAAKLVLFQHMTINNGATELISAEHGLRQILQAAASACTPNCGFWWCQLMHAASGYDYE